MQPGTGKNLSDPDLAHRRAQGFELPHQIPNEVREPVHWLSELHQATFAFLIDSPKPRFERLLIYHEDRSRLLVGPTSGCLELKDAHSLDRCVVRAFARGQPTPAGILDIQFFLEESDLVGCSLEVCTEAVICAPATGDSQGRGRQGDGVQ
jgi:hypothetical protein